MRCPADIHCLSSAGIHSRLTHCTNLNTDNAIHYQQLNCTFKGNITQTWYALAFFDPQKTGITLHSTNMAPPRRELERAPCFKRVPPWNQNIWKFMVRKLYFLSFYYYPPQEKNNNNNFLREVLRLGWCFLDVSGEDKFHHPVSPSGGARRNSLDLTASTNGCLPWSVEQPGGWGPALVLLSNFWEKNCKNS